jgi:hypothetical protein
VWSGDLSWDIPLERRITIVRGDSGLGKTTLINLINESQERGDSGVIVESRLGILIVSMGTWQLLMTSARNSILIFDDLSIVESAQFAKLIKDTEDAGNYYLIFSREEIGMDKFSMLSISISSILRFITSDDGKKHFTEPYYKLSWYSAEDIMCTNVLIEDKSAGAQFFKKVFGEDYVQSATSGKSTIVQDAIDLLKDNVECVLLVLPDMAAFGCNMDAFYNLVTIWYDRRIFFDSRYECFEELLLNTQYFKGNNVVTSQLESIEEFANKYVSWESYYEELLMSETKDVNGVEYKHSRNLSYCWINNCDKCEHKGYRECNLLVDGDKIEWLLRDTKYAKLLVLRKRFNIGCS